MSKGKFVSWKKIMSGETKKRVGYTLNLMERCFSHLILNRVLKEGTVKSESEKRNSWVFHPASPKFLLHLFFKFSKNSLTI